MSGNPGWRGPRPVYFAKGVRVFASGLLSIALPFYLKELGYGPFFQGVALVAILGGTIVSNLAVTYLDAALGRRKLLLVFSALMAAASALLILSTSAAPILAACFIGSISSTGTEAGPFQSIETGVLPELASSEAAVKVFGRYNLIGYSAAAAGQLAAAGPALAGYSIASFQAVFLSFGAIGVVLFGIYSRLDHLESGRSVKPGFGGLSPQGRKDLGRLSGLFSIDAFGAVFVTTYILSIWFNSAYGLRLELLGPIFFAATLVSAGSTYAAASIALRIGNLRTMVYTHLASSAFLILMGLSGSLVLALAFLFLRQSFSQMDVPTRQALMVEMFPKEERVQAYALTNVLRNTGSFFGGPVTAGVLGLGMIGVVPFAGGSTKILYDLLTFAVFRKRFP